LTFPILTTERLILSELGESDIDSIFEIFSNEAVIKYYDLQAFNESSQAEKLISLFKTRFESKLGIRWGIREKDTNILVGTCGFNSWSAPMKNAVIGYDLNPKYWGKGLAQEAVSVILHSAFSGSLPSGPIHRVQADTVPGNEASERLLSNLGFKYEGLRKDSGFWKNEFHDLKCFGLLAHEYKQI
jgi:ribosomal-protein-alanine N-acetyltransferase